MKLQMFIFGCLCSIGIISGDVTDIPFAGLVQYGALGLCAFMVFQSELQRRDMIAIQKEERKQSKELTEKLFVVHEETLQAIRKCDKK